MTMNAAIKNMHGSIDELQSKQSTNIFNGSFNWPIKSFQIKRNLFNWSINFVVKPLPLLRFKVVDHVVEASIVSPKENRFDWNALSFCKKNMKFYYLFSKQLTIGYSFRKHCGRNKLKYVTPILFEIKELILLRHV